MKRNILTLTLSFLLTNLFAQNWASVGSIWYYSQATLNPNLLSYKTIESTGDTLFQNKICKKMLETERYISPISFKTYLMYSDSDSVFYYDNDKAKFCLLYLFNAQQGDTINLDCFNLRVYVDSTETVTINGLSRKVQYISTNSLGASFWGTNIEGIGNSVYMFPQADMAMNGPLRCYEDSAGLVKFTSLACDTTIIATSIDEHLTPPDFKIYPNPASSKLCVTFNDLINSEYSIGIYSIYGIQQLAVGGTSNETSISIEKLGKGLYLVRIINEYGQLFEKKFIKE